jgi:hypothetical protein
MGLPFLFDGAKVHIFPFTAKPVKVYYESSAHLLTFVHTIS